jgi:hypothetical protein
VLFGALAGMVVVTMLHARAEHQEVAALHNEVDAKVKSLDRYCSLMRITAESVIQDIAYPIPEVTRDPRARRRLASTAIGMWNTLAELDYRALRPCLRPPVEFGTTSIVPEILPCADDDAACAVHYASIALGSFE